ncbi:MAG: LBF_2804 family protein, partial [Burkholderiales bacterium]
MPDQVSFHTMRAPIPDLEALGLQYLRRRAAVPSFTEPTDPIHILNPTEQAALRRIERGMVLRAAIAGALSGTVSAAAELIAIGSGPATTIGWLWVAGATLAATAMEIAYLYWDALRSVHDLAAAAGVRLFPPGVSISAMTATALARAALELPNRPDPRIPVNPYREASKAMLVAAAILYKLKIGLTNFLLKALIRRLGGRTLLRSWAPFVAVPVTALWNAWVARVVIHEARIRAMGPSATRERLDFLLQARSPLSPA